MHESLPTRLRVLRAERGLTLRDAEELTGVDKDTLSKIERGLRHPHDVTLAKIARGYGIGVEDLLEEPALAGTGPKAEAPEAGPAKQEEEEESLGDPNFELAHELALKDLRRAEQARTRAAESERPQTHFVRGYNEAAIRLLERCREAPERRCEELVGSYLDLMDGYVQRGGRIEKLEQENAELRDRLELETRTTPAD